MEIEELVASGDQARLFPVLSESSKEGRATSIFLSCLKVAPDLATSLFATLGRRVGPRTLVEVYTEVGNSGSSELRPDGLIVLRTGRSVWSALLEAKVGSSNLDQSQIEAYLDLARSHKIDAVITVSNQFVTSPQLSPTAVSKTKTRSVDLYHWSWMLIFTHCTLLLGNEQVQDEIQRCILSEFVRFLTHKSAGIQGFEAMPRGWEDVVNVFGSGDKLKKSDPLVSEFVSAWHQEEKDICLILSRMIQGTVVPKLSRAAQKKPDVRRKLDTETLCVSGRFETALSIPNAASHMNVTVDLAARAIQVSMRLKAPGDRVQGKARVTWLLRQLASAEPEGIDIIAFWRGKVGGVRASLASVREVPETALDNDRSNVPTSFEIVLFNTIKASRFKSRKGFVIELEAAVTDFYARVGQKLKAWQASAPKVKSESSSPQAVSTEKIQENLEGSPSFDN